MRNVDIVVVGGGPAGMAAAVSAWDAGCRSVLILERDHELGGILNQCVHNGFGLHRFKEELTGPEYAYRFIEQVGKRNIEYKLDTMVVDISPDRCISAVNRTDGMFEIQAGAIILAMGCRERPRGALNIAGYRPAGVITAGTAQRLVNCEGYMPGREVVMLGSGDIGLIMARRLTLEGAHIQVVAEVMPHSSGLKRNIVQCLDDFDIPLKLSHTVVDIEGKERVRAVTIMQVDQYRNPIAGTEQRYVCDTLLLSCGLIPENELSRSCGIQISSTTNGPVVTDNFETSARGIFACGNVLHVHDLVDYVSEEADEAGQSAYIFTQDHHAPYDARHQISIEVHGGVRYSVPSFLDPKRIEDHLTLRFRVGDIYDNASVCVYFNDTCVRRIIKRVLVPSVMEQIKLSKTDFAAFENLEHISLVIE